jgi:uncharacterized protein
MIVPWRDIDPETLNSLVREFILREGTDYGELEIDLETKIEQVMKQLQSNEAMIVYSELHETVNIQPHPKRR